MALRFPHEDIKIKALLLDPRIKSKAVTIVDDADALARAEHEVRLRHDAIFKTLKAREVITEESKDSGLEPPQTLRRERYALNSAMSSLLYVEVPSETTTSALHMMIYFYKQEALGIREKLSVKHGERDHPAAAVLARIYLGKPPLIATQERFF